MLDMRSVGMSVMEISWDAGHEGQLGWWWWRSVGILYMEVSWGDEHGSQLGGCTWYLAYRRMGRKLYGVCSYYHLEIIYSNYEFGFFVLLEDFKIAFSLFIPASPCIAITPLSILNRMSAQYQQAYKNSLSKWSHVHQEESSYGF